MSCELCKHPLNTHARFCSEKCKTIVRLRKRANKSLLEAEEKTFGEGYDSVIKRAWIRERLDSISSGKQDNELYNMYLARVQ